MIALEPWQWALAVLGALLVGISKTGIAGLGMLFVAIFANLFPSTRQATGIVLPLLIVGDLVAVLSYRRHTQWSHLWKLFPWTAAGILIGYAALGKIDDRQAQWLVGGIIVALVALQLWRRRRVSSGAEAERSEHGLWFAATIGVLAGFTTMVSNAAGPLMTVYLLAMRLPKMEFVGTAAVFFMLINWFKVPFMVHLELINADSLRFNLLLAPAVLVGAIAGRRLLGKINQGLFENLALAFSAIAGLRLLLG